MLAERIPQLARDERRAGWAGFAWGFAEGLFFFIIPDVYVTFATLFSLVAVTVIFLLTAAGVAYVNFLAAVPGIPWSMLEHVRLLLGASGLPYTLLLIVGGVPLKVYAGMAFSLGMSLSAVLLWTVFARVVRIAPVFALAALAHAVCARSIEQHAARWVALLASVWFVFYVVYFIRLGW